MSTPLKWHCPPKKSDSITSFTCRRKSPLVEEHHDHFVASPVIIHYHMLEVCFSSLLNIGLSLRNPEEIFQRKQGQVVKRKICQRVLTPSASNTAAWTVAQHFIVSFLEQEQSKLWGGRMSHEPDTGLYCGRPRFQSCACPNVNLTLYYVIWVHRCDTVFSTINTNRAQ